MDLSPVQNALASKSYATIADVCDELMLQARSHHTLLLWLSLGFSSPIRFHYLSCWCLPWNFKVASRGIDYQEEWPYAVHLLGHIFVNDLWASIFFSFCLKHLRSRIGWVTVSVDIRFFVSRNSAKYLWKSIPQGIKERRPELVAAWKIGQCLWTRDYSGVYDAIRSVDWSPEASELVFAFAGGVSGLIILHCIVILLKILKAIAEKVLMLGSVSHICHIARLYELLTSHNWI